MCFLGFCPVAVVFDELDEAGYGFGFRDVFQDAGFGFVETDATVACAYVAVVGVGHFAGAVYDAAHDAYL